VATRAEALLARAKTQSGLYSLIGGATTTRFYLGKAPQNATAPYCVQIGVSKNRPLAGSVSTGLVGERVQVSSFAATLTTAQALDAAVVAAFHEYDGTSASLVVQGIMAESPSGFEFYDADAKLWQVATDFRVWYEGT
jgi:hypothetical protein